MFNGPCYEKVDEPRLKNQQERVRELMQDGTWRTLEEIGDLLKIPSASASAQLRHLRKERFGSHTVEKRPRLDRRFGLYEYRLILNTHDPGQLELF